MSYISHYINKAVDWLNSNIQSDGSVYDSNVNSKLDHQYHLAWMIFINTFLKEKGESRIQDEIYKKLIDYQLNIPKKTNKNSNPFIAIPLILSYAYSSDIEIKNKIKEYIVSLKLIPGINDTHKANNFFLMKTVTLALKKVHMESLNEEEKEFIEFVTETKIEEWQLSDGFFFDKPFTKDTNILTPHLTYHATITMLTTWAGSLLGKQHLMNKGERGLHSLEMVTSPTGEMGHYGRSNNAVFGYGSAIFACSLIKKNKRESLDAFRTNLLDYISEYRSVNGNFHIVPNGYENERAGFDRYMFVTVYNSWFIGMLLLSFEIENE